jgi:EpsI family protein
MDVRAKAFAIALVMCAGSALALVARPTEKIADRGPKVVLEQLFPERFADWRIDTSLPVVLPSPDAQEVINRIYNQTLARTYVNSQGQRIMLSVAYGGDQSDSMAVHKPEVCYPAQGFEVLSSSDVDLQLAGRDVPARRLLTRLGGRVEPLTYWITVGDRVPGSSGFRQKFAQLGYGLRGAIPDGMIVRVSSIDRQADSAWALQKTFLDDLIAVVPEDGRKRVVGTIAAQP